MEKEKEVAMGMERVRAVLLPYREGKAWKATMKNWLRRYLIPFWRLEAMRTSGFFWKLWAQRTRKGR